MAELAIKGHKVRGKEVIALLEMLGGKNESLIPYDGRGTDSFYRITDDRCVVSSRFCPNKKGVKYQTYTLEVFEKEFPYKVGDEVRLGVSDEVCITNMYWDSCSDQVIYEALSVNGGREYDNLHAKQLSPCKEQTSPDKAKAPTLEGEDYSEGRCGYKIPEGFEFDKVENDEIILKPKKKALPKTYKECCEVLGIDHNLYLDLNHGDISGEYKPNVYTQNVVYLFNKLYMVRVCRDAYWKLAGEEMGLGKPWENDFEDDDNKFFISNDEGEIHTGVTFHSNYVLFFPTAEMRDTFYENFENLINECKELL